CGGTVRIASIPVSGADAAQIVAARIRPARIAGFSDLGGNIARAIENDSHGVSRRRIRQWRIRNAWRRKLLVISSIIQGPRSVDHGVAGLGIILLYKCPDVLRPSQSSFLVILGSIRKLLKRIVVVV